MKKEVKGPSAVSTMRKNASRLRENRFNATIIERRGLDVLWPTSIDKTRRGTKNCLKPREKRYRQRPIIRYVTR